MAIMGALQGDVVEGAVESNDWDDWYVWDDWYGIPPIAGRN